MAAFDQNSGMQNPTFRSKFFQILPKVKTFRLRLCEAVRQASAGMSGTLQRTVSEALQKLHESERLAMLRVDAAQDEVDAARRACRDDEEMASERLVALGTKLCRELRKAAKNLETATEALLQKNKNGSLDTNRAPGVEEEFDE